MSPAAAIYAIIASGVITLGFIFTWRWIADVRDDAAILKDRVGKLHHALEMQLELSRMLDKDLERIVRRSSPPKGGGT